MPMPSGAPNTPPRRPITPPTINCAPKSCARDAPIARATPISRSSSSTAVVMPVAMIAAHERNAIMVAISVDKRLAAICLSMPVRTRSAGSHNIGSCTRDAFVSLHCVTSIPSSSAMAMPVILSSRLVAVANVCMSISMSGRCSAPKRGR